MLFVWHDPAGGPPRFVLPEQDMQGWSDWSLTHRDFETGPVTIMQDLADTVHFESVHEYADVEVLEGPCYQGDSLSLSARFLWDTGLPGRLRGLPAAFQSRCHGLGYQCTETQAVWGRYQTRHLVLPRPLGGGITRVYLGTSARIVGRAGQLPGARLTRALAQRFGELAFLRDIARDARMWEALPDHAAHAPDERIHAYQEWVRRFYTPQFEHGEREC